MEAWIGAWNWQKKTQVILSHLLMLGYDMAHTVDLSSLEPPPSIWSGFSHKLAIFGHLEAWICARNWQKSYIINQWYV